MIGFKVVGMCCDIPSSLTRKKLVEGSLTYSLDHVTYPNPNCGPIAVFDNLEVTRSFKQKEGWRYNPIYVVEYEPEREITWLFVGSAVFKDLPPGTKLAKSVRLVACVGI